MSKEVIEQLLSEWQRMHSDFAYRPAPKLITEAADRIEELEREVERKMSAADFILKERDALQADNARLRDKFEHVLEYWNGDENYRAMSDALNHIEDVVSEALAATPEQSLARIRNQVREECALEADRQSEDEPYGHAKFRCANIALEIRAMKEPE